jgi:hypothetical protein
MIPNHAGMMHGYRGSGWRNKISVSVSVSVRGDKMTRLLKLPDTMTVGHKVHHEQGTV